ncbi:MAG: zinc ribbon domain-containing protein [Thermoplasmata archaeon]|nr:MAG: zinc ribbon domain-containing protein [Thermoplasmata archaeon]
MYCTKCGTKNEDDAAFCKKCGHNLQAGTTGPGPAGPPPAYPPPGKTGKSREEEQCERDCKGSDRESAVWWAIIVVIIGCWVIWEFGLKHVIDQPEWMNDDIFCTAIWIMIGIAILAAGVRMMTRRSRQT